MNIKSNKISGFSLIEMLIVIVVFAILAYFITQSTLQTFVGTRKADAQSQIRDNLNYAAESVERNLRNARAITFPSPCSGTTDHINYIDINNNAGSFSCNLTSGYLASGSATTRLTSDDILITSCSFTCTQQSLKPPVVDLSLVGEAAVSGATDKSPIAILRRIVLRVY